MKENGNDETNKRKRQQAQQYYHEERVKQASRYQYRCHYYSLTHPLELTHTCSHDDIMDGFAQMEAEILKFFGFDEDPVYQEEEQESYQYFTPVTTGPIVPGYN